VTRRPVSVIHTGPSSDGCTCSARNRLRYIIGPEAKKTFWPAFGRAVAVEIYTGELYSAR